MDRARRIVLLGPRGQVGWELRRTLAPLGAIFPLDRSAANLRDSDAVRSAVEEAAPHVIVNAAAYTDVDGAESDRTTAFAVNAAAPAALAAAARSTGALLVHFSTDYVFDGSARQPYVEQDATSPVSVYGESKRDGERAILESGADALVFRTSWVYGARGRNFMRTVLRLARERAELRIVDDQVGAPTWSRAIAETVAAVLARLATSHGFDLPAGAGGIYHLTAAGETSWYGFARAVLALDHEPGLRRATRVVPITTAEFPRPARRPAYSVLDNGRLARTFGMALPQWPVLLELALARDDPAAETPALG